MSVRGCIRLDAYIALSNAAWWLVENRHKRGVTPEQVADGERMRDRAHAVFVDAIERCRCSQCVERKRANAELEASR